MIARTALGISLAAVVTLAGEELGRRRPPGGSARWQRRNYRQRDVSLVLGPALAVGAAAGAAVAAPEDRATTTLLVLGCGAVGLYDDLAGDTHARGLFGHARALRQGRVTTGMVKLAGLVAAGSMAAAGLRRGSADLVVDSVLVAGTANLVNLLDLRPGRAAKAALLPGAVLVCRRSSAGAAAFGAALGALPADLGERAMIGDCGAGALGAMLGWGVVTQASRPARVGAAVAVVSLTLLSERVSFSRLIAANRVLRTVDAWGRAA